MIFNYVGGTSQQVGWAQSAVASCLYPLSNFSNTVTVHFTDAFPSGLDTSHPYMATVTHYSGHINTETFDIYVKTWADNPDHPENQGIPDPQSNIQEFYIESFVHEIGHVVTALTFDPGLLGSDVRVEKVCELFWRSNVSGPTGRDTGNTSFYSGDWVNAIKEAVAECFKCGFCPNKLVFKNRTNWHIDASSWDTLMAYLSARWKYLPPTSTVAHAAFGGSVPLNTNWTSSISLQGGSIGMPIECFPDLLWDGTPVLIGLASPETDLRPQNPSWWLPFPEFPLIPIEDPSQAAWDGLAEALGAPVGYDVMSDTQRSGWKALREHQWECKVPGVDWGILVYSVVGYYLKMDDTADDKSVGAVDMVGAPWGTDNTVIVGNAPPDAPQDPNIVAGWFGANPNETVNVTHIDEINAVASVEYFDGPGGTAFLPPGASTNPPPGTTARHRVPDLTGVYVVRWNASVAGEVAGAVKWKGYDRDVDGVSQLPQQGDVHATFYPVRPIYPVFPPYPFGGPGTIAVGKGLRGAVGVITPSGRQSTGAPVMLGSSLDELVQSNHRRGAQPGQGLRGHVLRPAGPRK